MSAIFKKKLSAKTIIGNVKSMVQKGEIKSGELLYRAIGIVDGMRTGSTAYGEFTGFSGEFEVTNMRTGEVFQGAEFFPDRSFTDALKSKLAAVPGQSVEFALEVLIDVDPDNTHYPMGFAYITRPIMADSVNRLSGLRDRIAALPAPEKVEDKKGGKK